MGRTLELYSVSSILDLFKYVNYERHNGAATWEEAAKRTEKKLVTCDTVNGGQVKNAIRSIVTKIRSSKQQSYFFKKYEKWLATKFTIKVEKQSFAGFDPSNPTKRKAAKPKTQTGTGTPGRPRKEWAGCSERTKSRRVELADSQELIEGAARVMWRRGQRRASRMLKEMCQQNRSSGSRPKQKNINAESKSLSIVDTVLWVIETDISLRTYQRTSQLLRKLPPYEEAKKMMEAGYPSDILASTDTAYVPLDSLIQNTAQRIMMATDIPGNIVNLTLDLKWGISTGLNTDLNLGGQTEEKAEEIILVTSLVPVELKCSDSGQVFWTNPTPGSLRFCRPIRVYFETTGRMDGEKAITTIDDEFENMESILKELGVLEVNVFGATYHVTPNMIKIMIDERVKEMEKNDILCNLCAVKPEDIDNIEHEMDDRNNVKFGISPDYCHKEIEKNIFELADKLSVSQRTYVDPTMRDRFSKEYEEELDRSLDAGISLSKAASVTKAFEIIARITNLDQELLNRLATVEQVLTCEEKVNIVKFEKYCLETAKCFAKKYSWAYLKPILRNTLIHAASFVRDVLSPIGIMGGEVVTIGNKVQEMFKFDFANYMDRSTLNKEIMKHLLLKSDPYFSSLSMKKRREFSGFSPEALNLLEIESENDDGESLDEENGDTDTDEDSYSD